MFSNALSQGNVLSCVFVSFHVFAYFIELTIAGKQYILAFTFGETFLF